MPVLEELNNVYESVSNYMAESLFMVARIIYTPIYRLEKYFYGRPY